MMSTAAKIRQQLAAAPKRKTFRKTRATLLEIAVALECLSKALNDASKENAELRAMITKQSEGGS